MTSLIGSTSYETWVLTLRAWSADPQTPLDHLPALNENSYTPDTYQRLIAQLAKAMQAVADRSVASIDRAVRDSQTTHDLARAMVDLRRSLARRGQLARHSSLPEPVRNALIDGFERDLRRWQSTLEDGLLAQLRTSIDRRDTEAMLRVVRDNSLLAVLSFSTGPTGSAPASAALPERNSAAPIAPRTGSGPSRRRIVRFPTTERA